MPLCRTVVTAAASRCRLGKLFAVAALAATASAAAALVPLPAYNVDPAQISVSGFSSGAFMAQQLGVSYSSRFMGVGVFAGGVYDCWRSGHPGCAYPNTPNIIGPEANMRAWSATLIDPVSNIARQKIYVFVGTNDTVVGPNTTNQVVNLYKDFTASSNIHYDNTVPAEHAFPTDYNAVGTRPCGVEGITNCGFDGAGTALQWIYGPLNPRNTGTLSGSLIQFDQGAFVAPGNGMDSEGWLYVPASCASGQLCRLHVALHGCSMDYAQHSVFNTSTGYNLWADTNNIIVLYPQTITDALNSPQPDEQGCWDGFAFYGLNYDQKGGVQIEALMRMVNQVSSGYVPNYSGLWWASPAGAESGWGINFAHQGNIIFATWFTYDLTGKAWWLSMTATETSPGTYSGVLYQTSGPAFSAVPFNPAAVTATQVGSGTLTFGDGNDGTFSYTVNGVSQTKAITRQVFGPVPGCTWGVQPDLASASNVSGLWWAAPAGVEAGWGINFSQQGSTIFATWFTYNADGTPLWLSATAAKTAPGVYTGALNLTAGPAFDAVPFLPAGVALTPVGTATFTFSDGNNGSFSYSVNVGTGLVSQTKAITQQVFRSPGTVCQ